MTDTTIGLGGLARKTNPYVAKKECCGPLLEVYQWAETAKSYCWPQIEERFLAGMWEFDQEFIAGLTDQRAFRRERAGFFRDIIILLLENCSYKALQKRRAAPGLIFPRHNLGTTYPKTGEVEILIQAKAVGTPNSAGNLWRKLRGGLDEWIKEASLKTIDLKADRARSAGQGGGPTSDLLTWLHQSKPLSFLFLAIGAVDAKDLDRTILLANAANQMLDGVALVAYETNAQGNGYQACKIPPHLELDRTLSRVCTALRNLP